MRDSLVSCYVKYSGLDLGELEGVFDRHRPLMDREVLDQIQGYLEENNEQGVRFEVVHYSQAEKFKADKEYY